jgi:tRNA A-37 threonylcarbamoyl transferase component Bud32
MSALCGGALADEVRILRVEVFPPESSIRAFFPAAPGAGDGLPNGDEVSIPPNAYTAPLRISAEGFETKEATVNFIKATATKPNYWEYKTSLRPESPSAFFRSQWHHHPLRSASAILGTLALFGFLGLLVRRRIKRTQQEALSVQTAAEAEVSKLKQKIVEGNLELEGEQIDDYSVVETLGEGTYSRVYKARHNDWKDLVALKLLKQETKDPEMLARTKREIEIGLELKHPNVVKMFAFGTYHGSPYIVTEFVPGRPLDEVLKEEGPFPLARACHIIEQLALGLEHAHSKGVIHRDLKPGNLFLTSDDQLKILDFGLARIVNSDQKLTKTGQALGTPIYMSPEQVRGKVSTASDYYAMGIIFYELLLGSPPFEGESAMVILSAHAFQKPPKVKDKNPEIPDEISDLIAALLIKRPEKRLQDADVVTQTAAVYKN